MLETKESSNEVAEGHLAPNAGGMPKEKTMPVTYMTSECPIWESGHKDVHLR